MDPLGADSLYIPPHPTLTQAVIPRRPSGGEPSDEKSVNPEREAHVRKSSIASTVSLGALISSHRERKRISS